MKSSKSSQQEDLKIADKLKTITSRCDNLLLLLANQEIERLAFKQHLQLLGEDHLHRALKAGKLQQAYGFFLCTRKISVKFTQSVQTPKKSL